MQSTKRKDAHLAGALALQTHCVTALFTHLSLPPFPSVITHGQWLHVILTSWFPAQILAHNSAQWVCVGWKPDWWVDGEGDIFITIGGPTEKSHWHLWLSFKPEVRKLFSVMVQMVFQALRVLGSITATQAGCRGERAVQPGHKG